MLMPCDKQSQKKGSPLRKAMPDQISYANRSNDLLHREMTNMPRNGRKKSSSGAKSYLDGLGFNRNMISSARKIQRNDITPRLNK